MWFSLLDIRHASSADDRTMLEYLIERQLPFIVALIKADKLNKSERIRPAPAAFEEEFAAYEGLTVISLRWLAGRG